MKPITTLLCAALLAFSSIVYGQNMSTSFSVVPQPGQPPYPLGSQVAIDLNVANFTSITSVSLPITYNSLVLRFDSIDHVAVPGYFDTTPIFHPTAGVVKVIWFPNPGIYPNGITMNDGRLMRLHFTVIGNGISGINVSTSVPYTPIEVINASNQLVFSPYIFNNGSSSAAGVFIPGGSGGPTMPPLVGFKIIANSVYGAPGERVCMPVTVNDFESITVMEFAMHWDNTVLNYDGCVRWYLPGHAFFNSPSPGTLLMTWEDPNLLSGLGVTVPDDFRAFDVCFNVVGAPNNQTRVTVDGLGFPQAPGLNLAEAFNVNNVNVWTTAGPTGPSGIADTVFVMASNPGNDVVTFSAGQVMVPTNNQTCVDIKVKNFSNLTEAEYQMTYDATKLSLVSPINIPATALNLQPANVVHSVGNGAGFIRFKWADYAGVSLADNTTIFSLCFVATGAPNSAVPVEFGTSPCPDVKPFAVVKKDVGGVPYKFEDGLVTIGMHNAPSLLATPPLCHDQSNGFIATTPNGLVSGYVWEGPGINFGNFNMQNPAGLVEGTYTVTITYVGGNTATVSASIEAPPAMDLSQTIVNASSFGGSNGAISIVPTGGTAPYTYDWSNDGPDNPDNDPQNISGLTANIYTVTITDAQGCSFVPPPFHVKQPNQPGSIVLFKNSVAKGLSTPSDSTVTNIAWESETAAQDLAQRSDTPESSIAENLQFELFQNVPNPANGTTGISFNLPAAANVTLTVTTAAGKVLKTWNAFYEKGMNTVILRRSELEAGLLYYRLNTKGFSATRKMIITD